MQNATSNFFNALSVLAGLVWIVSTQMSPFSLWVVGVYTALASALTIVALIDPEAFTDLGEALFRGITSESRAVRIATIATPIAIGGCIMIAGLYVLALCLYDAAFSTGTPQAAATIAMLCYAASLASAVPYSRHMLFGR